MIRQILPLALLAMASVVATAQSKRMNEKPKGQYATVNGLKMYYEVHEAEKESGHRPLFVLHGAFGTAKGWAMQLPTLRKNRKVILIEVQGHGHTADRDTPLTLEGLADDLAALMRAVKMEGADVFGYSLGGRIGLATAIRHPGVIGKLAVLGAGTGKLSEIFEPESYKVFASLPDDFSFPSVRDPYDRAAPDPSKWPVLVQKVKKLGLEFEGFSEKEVRSISCPTLIMQGDKDGTKPEHAVQMFRWIPKSQLYILPNSDHFALYTTPDAVLTPLLEFLDGPDDAKPAPIG